jgi:type III pantothenate kinase
MLLVYDIGNTTIDIGLFKADRFLGQLKLLTAELYDKPSNKHKLEAFLEEYNIPTADIKNQAICSVVPKLTDTVAKMAESLAGKRAWIFDYTASIGMKIKYDDPAQLGSDRLANVLAVKTIYGTPAIAVDFGTATKLEAINSAGDYLGGAIAPGIAIAAEALFKRGARLFPVDIEKPDKAIATNSADAMKAGIFYGAIGQIDYLIEKMITELGQKDIKIIATGGLAEKFAPYSKYIQKHDPILTLQGIRIGFELSHSR